MREVTIKIGEAINAPVFETFIRNSIIVEEAQARGSELCSFGRQSTAAEDYDMFVDEYLGLSGKMKGVI